MSVLCNDELIFGADYYPSDINYIFTYKYYFDSNFYS